MIMVTISGVGLVPFGALNLSVMFNILLYAWFLMLTLYFFEKDLKKRLLWVIWIIIVQQFAGQYFPVAGDYGFYLFFSFLIGRFLGVDHPRAVEDRPLSKGRRIVGWITLAVFVVSFTPRPLYIEDNEKARDQPGLEVQYSQSEVITGGVVETD
jgi:hypothetical protein